ncbi:alpha-adducin-like [Rhopilema esculentum]|uniref:alpha-adducin-like n=1 Tax=Rhopilema esculentum TaxID=499914 RepID=UPI0031DC4D5C
MDVKAEEVRKQNLTNMKIKRISDSQARHHSVRRPDDVVRDVRGLKLRQRVSLVLGDDILRKELEDIVESTTTNGPKLRNGIRTYQDFLIPTMYPGGYNTGGSMLGTVTPINDIRGMDTLSMSKAERVLRTKLAAVYRLVDLFGWSQVIYNHISVRVSEEKNHFLINPFGLLYSEITSSSLVKIDGEANIVDSGSTSFGISKAGFVLHSAIHLARKDAKCIIHVHHEAVEAVSAMKCGLLRISQESAIVGHVSYHNFNGILVDEAEKESIVHDLGDTNKVMILRNHGVVCLGETIEEAFSLLYHVIKACEIQVRAIPVGLDNLHIYDEEIVDQVQKTIDTNANYQDKSVKWRKGEMEFEALMRKLDSLGYNTGYPYRMPDAFLPVKREKIPESRDVPIFPSFNLKKGGLGNYPDMGGPLRPSPSRGTSYKNKLKWLNSPVLGTQYKKEPMVKTEESHNQLHTVRKEITRSGSENNVDMRETEVTEVTETVEGGTITTVKRKVVTVIQGKEQVIEDSQILVDGNDTAFSSVIDSGFVVVDKEDGHAEQKEISINIEENVKHEPVPTEVAKNHDELLRAPGSPASQHSSQRSDDEGGDDDHDRKKVKKQRSFKKMFQKKPHKKK